MTHQAAVTPAAAITALSARIRPGATVVLHSGCGEPPSLAGALAEQSEGLRGMRLATLMPMGDPPWASTACTDRLDVGTFFPGRGLRRAVGAGRVRIWRHTLSALPGLFTTGTMRADAVLLQVSPPDADGFVSLGVSVDYLHAVLGRRPWVVAEVNPAMPATSGDTRVHVSRIDCLVHGMLPPQAVAPATPDAIDLRIAGHVASLVEDGAVLQVGIGSLPEAVLGRLGHLRRLGLHSGVVCDAVRPLFEAGVIDNSTKTVMPGVGVTTMAAGTQAFYDWLHRNPALAFRGCDFTHGAATLERIDGLCAINAALQVDLAGRVNAEWADDRRVSMPGGMPDFASGATHARGGLSIVALRATHGPQARSTLVPALDTGSTTLEPVHVDFIVTEFGAAPVRGVAPEARAAGLLAIADPRHRDALAHALKAQLSRQPAGEPGHRIPEEKT